MAAHETIMYFGTSDQPPANKPARPAPNPSEPTPEDIIHAVEEAYEFPGYYPIVVIARTGEDFEELLRHELTSAQGDLPYTIDARLSRHGNYVSYRVEVFVGSAQDALERKAALAVLEGVLMML